MKFQSFVHHFEPIPVRKSKECLTVPDMSFTPREIISKFSRGEKVPLGFQGLYDSEDDDLSGYDPQIFEDDPTRDPEFDFGDYVEEKHALEQRMREAKYRSKVKGDPGSKRKASNERVSASDQASGATTSGETGAPAPGEEHVA